MQKVISKCNICSYYCLIFEHAAYIPYMTDEILDEFFNIDGKQLTSWTTFMKTNNARRLQFILAYYARSMVPEELKTILIRLMSLHKICPKDDDENLNKCFYRQLRHVKQFLFNTRHTQTKQYDSFLAKKPVFLLISQWFFEFNIQSKLVLTDFVSHIASVGSNLENVSSCL